ncbi:MaoC family dehydratase [Actinoplanes sichuanensis]|nr:MaoC family dehydratase [Actinoplanes sichuanensis]
MTRLMVPFDELPGTVGTRLVSPWTSVEVADTVVFETVTRVPVATEAGYDHDVVAGFQLLSMLDHLVSPMITVTGGPSAWNYGLDRVRFIQPVHAGERFRATVRIVEVLPRPTGHLLRADVEVEVDGRPGPAFVAQLLLLWPRDDG